MALKVKVWGRRIVRKVGLGAGATLSHYASQEFADSINKDEPEKGEETINLVFALAGVFSEEAGEAVGDEYLGDFVTGTLDGAFAMSVGKMAVNYIKEKAGDKTKMRAISGVGSSEEPQQQNRVASPELPEQRGFVRDNQIGNDGSADNSSTGGRTA